MQPTYQPSGEPSGQPTVIPSGEPSNQPSGEPSKTPVTSYPTLPGDTNKPTRNPTIHPSSQPSTQPSGAPSELPTSLPSSAPTRIPYFIDTLDVSTTESEIIIRANVSQESILQCAVYQDPDFPLSINNVIFQNHKAISENLYAVLTIPNLATGIDYRLYCITRDFDNIISMSYGRLLETSISVQLKGSRKLFVDLSSTVVSTTKQHVNILTISWQKLPTDDLTIVLNTVYGEDVTVDNNKNVTQNINISSVFEPKVLEFSPSRKYLSLKASLPSNLIPGTYTLDFALLGPHASDYEISYSDSAQKFLVNNTYQPSAPGLKSVLFSDDGSYLVVKLDSNTNQGGFRTHFACTLMFDFQYAEDSSCVWVDKKTVYIYLKVAITTIEIERSVAIGDEIVLLPDVLRAECTASEFETCQHYVASSLQNVSVSAPTGPITPALILSAPTIISACSGFTLDLTGSTGDGGRPWTKVSITVQSLHSSTRGMLNNYYREVYKVFPPSPVARNHFSAGFNYTFSIYLCNFLQKCSTVLIHEVKVINGEIPNVSFYGLKYRHIYRYQQLSLRSNAFSTFCGAAESTKSLEYAWGIIQDGSVAEFESTSKQPASYILPPYTLQPASVYNVSVTVYSNLTGLSATSTVDIFVGQGDLKAVVLGGSAQSLDVGSSMVIDASSSYDEDIEGLSGALAGLEFQWSCSIVQPVVNTSDCGVDFIFTNSTGIMTLKSRGDSYVATTSAIKVVISKDTRIDEVTTTITIAPADSPRIVVNLDNRNNINSKQVSIKNKIKLLGNVELFEPASVTWSIDDTLVFLSEVALTPVTSDLDANIHSVNLVLEPYALAAKSMDGLLTTAALASSFRFSLQSSATVSTIEVFVAEAPYGGQLTSEPEDGIEWFTTFAIAAKQWISADLPLTYEIGFLAMDGTYLPLEKKSEKTFARSYFGHGDPMNLYKVALVLAVYNNFNGKTLFQKDILVKKSTTTLTDIAQRIPTILNNLNGETNSDYIKLLISVFISPMNVVDCSDVPVSCESIQRQDCRAIDNTCGPCVDGYFGDADSNVPCYLVDTNFPTQQPTNRPTRSPSVPPSGQPSTQPSGQPTGQPSSEPTYTVLPTCVPSAEPSGYPTHSPVVSLRRLEVDFSLNCTTDSQCANFEYCNRIHSTCNITQKFCHHNCSNHGNCYFEEVSTGLRIDSCSSQDVKCEPVCNCSEAYSGKYCSLNATIGEVKTSSRLELLSALQSVLFEDNYAEESTISLISTLFNIGKDQNELNVTSCGILLNMIEFSLTLSKDFHLSFDELNNAMYVVNECGYIYASNLRSGLQLNNRNLLINEYLGRIIDKYSEVVFQDAVFGQADTQLNYPLFKVVNAIRLDTDINKPIFLSLGATLAARYDNVFSSVTILIDKQFPKLQLSLYETAKRFVNRDILSNPLQLSIAFGQMDVIRDGGDEISGTATFVLQNDYPVVFGKVSLVGNVTFQTYCNDTLSRVSEYECPNGYVVTHTCAGRVGVITTTCPRSTWQPLCSLIDGSVVHSLESITQCKRLDFSSTSTTCSCSLPNFNIHSKERTLEVTTVGAFLPDPFDVTVFFDSDEDYYDHFQQDSSVVYSFLLVVFCLGVLLMVVMYFQNYFGLFCVVKKVGMEMASKGGGGGGETSDAIFPVSGMEKVKWVFSAIQDYYPSDSFAFYSQEKSVDRLCQVIFEHHMFTSWVTRKTNDNTSKHTSCSIDFGQCLYLFTNVISLIFVFALFFDLQYPGNKSMCTRQLTQSDCVGSTSQSLFDSQHNLCYWYLSHRAVEVDVFECAYREVELTGWGVALLMLVVSGAVMPLRFLIDFIFGKFIFASTSRSEVKEEHVLKNAGILLDFFQNQNKVEPLASDGMNDDVIDENDEVCSGDEQDIDIENNNNNVIMTIQNQIESMEMSMDELICQIKLQRQHLTAEELVKFDEKWYWDNALDNFVNVHPQTTGPLACFYLCKQNKVHHHAAAASENTSADPLPVPDNQGYTSPQKNALAAAIQTTNQRYIKIRDDMYETSTFFEFLKDTHVTISKYENNAEDVDRYLGQVLLHTFVGDELGYKSLSGKVFMTHLEHIFQPKKLVRFIHKVLAVLLLIGINAFSLYYAIKQSVSREASYQHYFLVAYLIQFSIDVWYFEAVICALMYYVIPSMISGEVQNALRMLQASAQNAFLFPVDLEGTILNSPRWFHVSNKLANVFPHLLESQTILAHHDYFYHGCSGTDPHHSKHEKFYHNFSLTAKLLLLCKVIGTQSLEVQRLLLFLFLLSLYGCAYGLAMLSARMDMLWLLFPVGVVTYEVMIWTILHHFMKNIVCNEDLSVHMRKNGNREYMYDMEEVITSIKNENQEQCDYDIDSDDVVNKHEEESKTSEKESGLQDQGTVEDTMNSLFNDALTDVLSKGEERKTRVIMEDSFYQTLGRSAEVRRSAGSKQRVDASVGDSDFRNNSLLMSPPSGHSDFLVRDWNDTAGVKVKVKSAATCGGDVSGSDGIDDYLVRLGMRPNSSLGVVESFSGSGSSVLMSQTQQGGGGGHSSEAGSPTCRRNNFIRPKRERAQEVTTSAASPLAPVSANGSGRKPRRIARDGNDSSSDESVVELNEIFDHFFNSNKNEGDDDGENDDDDSVEDYNVLASKFDFRDSDDEE
jgi:hypothetical protein